MAANVQRTLQLAKSHERRGQVANALRCYRAILGAYPANQRVQKAIARLTVHGPAKSTLRAIHDCYVAGQLQAALDQARTQVDTYPESEVLWTLLGASAIGLGEFKVAKQAFTKATQINPNVASNHANLAAALERLGEFSLAVYSFSRALMLSEGHADYHLFRGNSLMALGDTKAAIKDFKACIHAAPKRADAHRSLGQALHQDGQIGPAIVAYETALVLDPIDIGTRVDLAEKYIDAAQHQVAEKHLQTALALDPDSSMVNLSLGTLCLAQNEIDRAIRHLKLSLEGDPTNIKSWNNLSSAQFASGQYEAAEISCNKALALGPDHAKAHHNLANLFQNSGKLDLAVESYASAIRLDPSLYAAQTQMLHFQAHMCDWTAFETFANLPAQLNQTSEAISPFTLLAFEDDPARQRQKSEHYAQQWHNNRPVFAKPGVAEPGPGSRLRIGYFSSDLYDHATLFLLNGVLENHDKSRFEIFVYGFNSPRKSPQFDRLVRNVDRFTDVHAASDADIVAMARHDKIDIAIDLKGYTQGARPGLFFAGLAPVQINYLGYPGTLGTDAFDYIIADDMVIPPDCRQHYTENVIYLPHSYQPNDDLRHISPQTPSRQACALPENAVVLCCFNNSYKITPQVFDIWMRLLDHVDNAVLWLLDCNNWAKTNLRAEAKNRGIAPGRLIFAPRLAQDKHLARHRLADIFMDTFHCNAHTTASDALFAGLPVVTLPGKQFAARVGASLCRAVGLNDLIAPDEAGYEQLILDLATNTVARTDIRSRLMSNLKTAPLFNTISYTRDLETGYRLAWNAWQRGDRLKDIQVPL